MEIQQAFSFCGDWRVGSERDFPILIIHAIKGRKLSLWGVH
jgi:hypothetical protein